MQDRFTINSKWENGYAFCSEEWLVESSEGGQGSSTAGTPYGQLATAREEKNP